MNEHEENLVRQSKWNGKRIVLLYWFIVLFIGTGTAVGLGIDSLNPKYSFSDADSHSTFGIPDVWHPEDCSPCHDDKIDGWNQTKHANISSLVNDTIGDYNETFIVHGGTGDLYNLTYFLNQSSGCCHVTKFNTTGDNTVWDFGVSCAACHDEPGVTTYSFDPGSMSFSCAGRCHIPGSKGKQASASGHYDSLDDLLVDDIRTGYCLHCMSGQGIYTDDKLTNIDCVTCHDPHSEEGYEYDLRRATTTELCGVCHGISFEFLNDTTTPSATTNTTECIACHGYYWNPGGFGMAGPTPPSADLNHTWALVLPDACGQCHGNDNATYIGLMEEIQGDTSALMLSYEGKKLATETMLFDAKLVADVNMTKIGEINDLIDEAKALYAYVYLDASNGFHNPDLAEDKLKLAIVKLEEAYDLAEALLPEETTTTTPAETTTTPEETTTTTTTPATSTPGFELFALLAILGLAVFIRKKK